MRIKKLGTDWSLVKSIGWSILHNKNKIFFLRLHARVAFLPEKKFEKNFFKIRCRRYHPNQWNATKMRVTFCMCHTCITMLFSIWVKWQWRSVLYMMALDMLKSLNSIEHQRTCRSWFLYIYVMYTLWYNSFIHLDTYEYIHHTQHQIKKHTVHGYPHRLYIIQYEWIIPQGILRTQ